MFLDRVKILCKAGNGGNGSVAFRREKFVPNGGPDGGDGGKGGDIIFQSTSSMTNLGEFRFKKVFKAENGDNGSGNNKYGKSAKDMTILVPIGTIIKNSTNNKILADFINDNEKVVLLKGGNGGKGNAKFATSTKQAPMFAENGIQTKEFELLLELKTIADVGLVGFPNVGKSSLLSQVSNAKPKIANYHFTTLAPNVAVVKAYNSSFVMADIPGLISGASEGLGLGYDFLMHIERTRLLIHVVDISGSEGRDPYKDYLAINYELSNYSEKVSKIPQIIALNKMDLVQDEKIVDDFIKKLPKDAVVCKISAISKTGIDDLMKVVVNKLSSIPKPSRLEVEEENIDRRNNNMFKVYKINETFVVEGDLIDEILRGVVLDDFTSNAYFQKRIKDEGIDKELKKLGIKEGDKVKFGDIEFEYAE